jgi:hypothetical protein
MSPTHGSNLANLIENYRTSFIGSTNGGSCRADVEQLRGNLAKPLPEPIAGEDNFKWF